MSSNISYRPEIDGLRAIAVILVIAFHAGVGKGGFLGVDIFFVISGYLIGSIVLKEASEQRFSVRSFLDRRIRRIAPALIVLCSLCTIPAWILLPPSDFRDFGESLLANAFFNANHLFLSESGYFSTTAELKPLLHTWSLSVELQFYFLVALLSFVFLSGLSHENKQRHAIFYRNLPSTIFTLILLLSVFFTFYFFQDYSDLTFYTLPFRLWEFAIGITAAILVRKRWPCRPILSYVGFVLILVPIIFYENIALDQPSLTFLCVTGTALFISATKEPNPITIILSSRLFVAIGSVSYSLYLIHNPIISFAKYTEIDINAASIAIGLSLMGIYAFLSWKLIETPFRNKRKVNAKVFYSCCTFFCICTICFVIATKETEGFIHTRLNLQQQDMLTTAIQDKRTPYCQTGGNNYRPAAEACSLNGNRPSWAIFGDSHAGSIAYAFADTIFEHTGESTQWLSMRGAPPEKPAKSPNSSQKWIQEAITFLAQADEIHTVVVAYRLNVYMYGSQVDNYPLKNESIDPELREHYWEGYTHIINELAKSNKRIIIVSPIPEPRKRVNDLIFQEGNNATTISAVSRKDWDNRNHFTLKHLTHLKLNGSAEIFYPENTLCNLSACFAVKKGKSLYYDHNHLSKYGAAQLANDFASWLTSQQ